MIKEGQTVTYLGPSVEGIDAGDTGRVLVQASENSVHLQMTSGNRVGYVYLIENEDLGPVQTVAAARDSLEASLEDSLDVGSLSTFAVRDTFEGEGEIGVLNAMAQNGHLAAFSSIAEEAVTMIASRIRQDPSFREVLAHLDEEEGESLLRLASACLVRDAFDEGE